jgi:hypothetical protein
VNLPDSMPCCSSAMVVSSSSNVGTWAGWLTGRAEARMGENAAAIPVTAVACKRARRDSLFDLMIPRTLAQGLAWRMVTNNAMVTPLSKIDPDEVESEEPASRS